MLFRSFNYDSTASALLQVIVDILWSMSSNRLTAWSSSYSSHHDHGSIWLSYCFQYLQLPFCSQSLSPPLLASTAPESTIGTLCEFRNRFRPQITQMPTSEFRNQLVMLPKDFRFFDLRHEMSTFFFSLFYFFYVTDDLWFRSLSVEEKDYVWEFCYCVERFHVKDLIHSLPPPPPL